MQNGGSGALASSAGGEPRGSAVSAAGLRQVLGNVALAALFFITLLPGQSYSGPANGIWMVGAVLMGFFSLVRRPAMSTTVSYSAIAAVAGMMLIPGMLRPGSPTSGAMLYAGLTLEVIGVTLGQGARIYLGRSFGLLPANRGVVSSGPFGLARHPVYLGWLILTVGYVLAYFSWANIAIVALGVPFMMWRIRLEEQHLCRAPDYAAYMTRVRWRLIPGLY